MPKLPFLKTVEEMYSKYARHVLGFRHFSEGRDGLKPVQRRGIWAMYQLGAVDKLHMSASAAICGTTTGSYHPHEDGSVYKAVAGMSQANTLSPLVMGIGNWGNDIEPAAAMRYTKAYLSPYALSMLDVDELTQVPMDPTYDGKRKEPRYLPARLPHLLLSGVESIAPGYKGNIPPCDPDWVMDAIDATIAGKSLQIPKRMAYRWGGRMLKLDKCWLRDGTGTGEFMPRFRVEGKQVIITTLAPHLDVEAIEKKLGAYPCFAGLVADGVLNDNDLMRIVVQVRRGHTTDDVMDAIKKSCVVRDHFSFLQIAQRSTDKGDVDYDPIIEGPQSFLVDWVEWRKLIISGAARHRMDVLRSEISRLNLLLRVIDKRKELDKIRESARDRDDVRGRVQKLFSCTGDEASMVMAIPWPKLAHMECEPLIARRTECEGLIKRNDVLARSPIKRLMPDAEVSFNALIDANEQAKEMRKRESKPKSNRRKS